VVLWNLYFSWTCQPIHQLFRCLHRFHFWYRCWHLFLMQSCGINCKLFFCPVAGILTALYQLGLEWMLVCIPRSLPRRFLWRFLQHSSVLPHNDCFMQIQRLWHSSSSSGSNWRCFQIGQGSVCCTWLLIGRPCAASKFVMILWSCLVLFLQLTFCGPHRRHLCWTLLIVLVDFSLLKRWVWLIWLW
jgi:hypothetical protein